MTFSSFATQHFSLVLATLEVLMFIYTVYGLSHYNYYATMNPVSFAPNKVINVRNYFWIRS